MKGSGSDVVMIGWRWRLGSKAAIKVGIGIPWAGEWSASIAMELEGGMVRDWECEDENGVERWSVRYYSSAHWGASKGSQPKL